MSNTFGITIYSNNVDSLEALRRRLETELCHDNWDKDTDFDIDGEVSDYGEPWDQEADRDSALEDVS